ncbi:MAG: preprotein translocase subunit SecY, partial [Gemmataceae bacterium]
MNWRRLLLGGGGVAMLVGIVLVAAGTNVQFAGGLVAVGIAAVIIGIAPEQLLTIFRIPELQRKILITLLFLAVYRIGYYVPLPMIDQNKLAESMANAQSGTMGQLFGFVSMFSGGNLSSGCIFAVGIMPYISASIILQLLSSGVLPSLERLRKEGESGRKKINEYTRYLTVPICFIQSILVVQWLTRPKNNEGGGMGLAIDGYTDGGMYYFFGITTVLLMT